MARRSARTLAAKLGLVARSQGTEPEVYQARDLVRAYGKPNGPELLVFGDSTMFWVQPGETDRMDIAQYIRSEVGGGRRVHSCYGAGLNPRIVMAYLAALTHSESRPEAVVVPISTVMASSSWLAHPNFGHAQAAEAVMKAIETGDFRHRPIRFSTEQWEAFDRLRTASLVLGERDLGELRVAADIRPATPWQERYKLRAMTDFYFSEQLEPDQPGVALVEEMGRLLRQLNLPAVGYVAPLNVALAVELIGPESRQHLSRNAAIVTRAFLDAVGPSGAVVNTAAEYAGDEFFDSAHLVAGSRRRLAATIAAEVQAVMRPLVDDRRAVGDSSPLGAGDT